MDQPIQTPETLQYAVPAAPRRNTAADIARRALLWTVMCTVCAVPSFMWASRWYSRPGMICGVVLFIVAYTVMTSTPAFLKFCDRPFVRRTLYIGYGIRLGASIIFPLGMAIDMIPGIISIGIVNAVTGLERSFEGTLLITIVQGTIINVLLSILMAFIWLLQKLIIKNEPQPRGFPVELGDAPSEDRGAS